VKLESLINVRQISCGSSFTIVLDYVGEVFVFGYNGNGQLGLGNDDTRDVPHKVNYFKGIKMVDCGADHTIVVKNNGELYGFGSDYDELGLPVKGKEYPIQIAIPPDGFPIKKVKKGEEQLFPQYSYIENFEY